MIKEPSDASLSFALTTIQEVLGRDVLPQDDLLEIGVDSLYAVELAVRFEDHFGVDCPPDLFFQVPSIGELVARLRSENE